MVRVRRSNLNKLLKEIELHLGNSHVHDEHPSEIIPSRCVIVELKITENPLEKKFIFYLKNNRFLIRMHVPKLFHRFSNFLVRRKIYFLYFLYVWINYYLLFKIVVNDPIMLRFKCSIFIWNVKHIVIKSLHIVLGHLMMGKSGFIFRLMIWRNLNLAKTYQAVNCWFCQISSRNN